MLSCLRDGHITVNMLSASLNKTFPSFFLRYWTPTFEFPPPPPFIIIIIIIIIIVVVVIVIIVNCSANDSPVPQLPVVVTFLQ